MLLDCSLYFSHSVFCYYIVHVHINFYVYVLLNFMHLQQFVNMVPNERSSMVGLPHYI